MKQKYLNSPSKHLYSRYYNVCEKRKNEKKIHSKYFYRILRFWKIECVYSLVGFFMFVAVKYSREAIANFLTSKFLTLYTNMCLLLTILLAIPLSC
jgi:hypothetical protein